MATIIDAMDVIVFWNREHICMGDEMQTQLLPAWVFPKWIITTKKQVVKMPHFLLRDCELIHEN